MQRAVYAKIRIWDLPTRLGHWLIVLLLLALWGTAHFHLLNWHNKLGYVLLALLFFRLYWGIGGSSTARFGTFLRGPRALMNYARTALVRKTHYTDLGHNPIGGWSVVILITLMLLQVGLGLFSVDIDGLDSGPLSSLVAFDLGRRMARLHHIVFNLLLVFALAHIAAVLFYLIFLRRNLITPMITGSIDNLDSTRENSDNLIFASWRRVFLGIVVAVLLTSAIVLL